MTESTDSKTLDQLGGDIDQLASEARDFTEFPEVAKALDLAWWLTEDALRTQDSPMGSCGHALQWKDLVRRDITRPWCACCSHYLALYNKGTHLRGIL